MKMTNNKNKKDGMKKQNDIDYDWITSLAKNSASNDVNRIASKEDRKRKRQEKKKSAPDTATINIAIKTFKATDVHSNTPGP